MRFDFGGFRHGASARLLCGLFGLPFALSAASPVCAQGAAET